MIAAEITGADPDKQRRIGVFARSRILAHSIGDDPVLLGRSAYHLPARTHAECIDAASVRKMFRKPVIRSADQLVKRGIAVPAAVYQFLRMLDPGTDGKALLVHRDPGLMKDRKRITGAVSDR